MQCQPKETLRVVSEKLFGLFGRHEKQRFPFIAGSHHTSDTDMDSHVLSCLFSARTLPLQSESWFCLQPDPGINEAN